MQMTGMFTLPYNTHLSKTNISLVGEPWRDFMSGVRRLLAAPWLGTTCRVGVFGVYGDSGDLSPPGLFFIKYNNDNKHNNNNNT
jgi:hypothetical protein